jgi:hypothetical protein
MNIRSLFKALTSELPAVQKEEVKTPPTSPVTSKGIASVTDSYETSRINFFNGEKLDADSLRQEQDYSREMFDPHKRYSGVVMQEGRVQTDADSNESTHIEHEKAKFIRESTFTHFKDDDD